MPRWVAPVFTVLAVIAVPWVVYLAVTLPRHETAAHYDLAWVGFDVLLLVGLARTAWTAWRAKPYVELPAVATATLLLVDAWFDVLTSRRDHIVWAILQAVFVELPLAGLCIWVARHAEAVRAYRTYRTRRPR